jgi:tetratricopeptide (TPR) repeat protein
MEKDVKHRFFNGTLLFAIAAIAVVLYLKVGQRGSAQGTMEAAHGSNSMITNAGGAVPGNLHEKQILTKALEKNPEHAPVLLKLAQIEAEAGRFQEASGFLRKILKKEPDNPEANLELGKVLFRLGDASGAIERTEGILKTHPNYEDALYNIGAIYANTGNRRQAMEYWNRLAALHSNSESAKMALQMMRRIETTTP